MGGRMMQRYAILIILGTLLLGVLLGAWSTGRAFSRVYLCAICDASMTTGEAVIHEACMIVELPSLEFREPLEGLPPLDG